MKLLILAQDKKSYTTRRLLEAAKKAGCKAEGRAPARFRLGFGSEPTADDGRANGYDVVLPRFGASQQTYGVAVLRQLEAVGVRALNSAQALALVRNRVQCTQMLSLHGIPVPRAMLVRRPEDVDHAIERVGGLPVMLRRVSGQATFATLFCETKQGCLASLEAMWGLGHEALVVQHFTETQGEGLRCLSLNGEIIAAIRRKGRTIRTRFRFERRGSATEITPTRTLKALVAQVHEATGLRLAGVDLLETSDGLRVFDVNAAPGIEQLETATGRDLAKLVIESVVQFAGVAPKRKKK